MYHNRLKQLLAEGQVPIGTYVASDSPIFAEILAQTSIDFVIIETEHGPLSPLAYGPLTILIKIFHSHDVTPLVRVPKNDQIYIGKALDAGASGVVAPHVTSRESALALVSATRFPPEGTRGCGPLAAANEYIGPYGPYANNANAEVMAVPLIEDAAGVENFEEIAGVDGIDMVKVGSLDLALSMGLNSGRPDGGMNHPAVIEAREKVLKICLEKGIAIDIHGFSPEIIKEALASRKKVLMDVGTDVGTFHKAYVDKIDDARSQIRDATGG